MGVFELFKEFKSMNIVRFLEAANNILVDACIYWEFYLPNENDFAGSDPALLKLDPEFRKSHGKNFLAFLFSKLLKLELDVLEENSLEVKIIFDNSCARSWLKFSRCMQRMRNRDVLKAKRIRFFPSMDELTQWWQEIESLVGAPTLKVLFVEAPSETDDYIHRECLKLLSSMPSEKLCRQVILDNMMCGSETNKSFACSKISIYSADSDFVSFFPFCNQINVCHGEVWNKSLQITRLLNFEPTDSTFWITTNSLAQDNLNLKLALFKTFVIARGHNDYMTCAMSQPKKEINWSEFIKFLTCDDVYLKEDINVSVFFSFIYYLHLDTNINPLKIKQIVGNALRLFVADPPDGQTWTFMELGTVSPNKDVKLISKIEDLKDFLAGRVELMQNLDIRSEIEAKFKRTCIEKNTQTVNISLALTEWYAYYDLSYQNHIGGNKQKKRKIDHTKWEVFREMNLVVYKAVVLFYIGLFKIWFFVDTPQESYSAFSLFLKRVFETLYLGNDTAKTFLDIKESTFFLKLLNHQ